MIALAKVVQLPCSVLEASCPVRALKGGLSQSPFLPLPSLRFLSGFQTYCQMTQCGIARRSLGMYFDQTGSGFGFSGWLLPWPLSAGASGLELDIAMFPRGAGLRHGATTRGIMAERMIAFPSAS